MDQVQANLGYAPGVAATQAEPATQAQTLSWLEAGRIALVALTAAGLWMGFGVQRSGQGLAILVLALGGWPIFKPAFKNLAARRMTMELSMSIAILAAAAISQFFTALIILLFVLVAEVLERLTVSRGRRAVAALLEQLPRTVMVRDGEGVHEVFTEQLRVGDVMLVNPGGLVAVDGAVVSGHSFVDQARITGESMPVEKLAGAPVYAGTINQSGLLAIEVGKVGRDTSYGRIIEAIERAERARAPVQQLADRLAGYLVYFALAAAALTFVLTRDARSTIAVIIVAGACGIAAGTPLAILGGIGRAARLGAIIKGGLYLELLGKVDTVVFDKTGTLTLGRAEVQTAVAANGCSRREVMQAAAGAELRSEHPLGKAIVAFARANGIVLAEPESFDYEPGRGIRAVVDGARVIVGNRALFEAEGISLPPGWTIDPGAGGEVLVAREGRLLGAVAIADSVRPEARQALTALRRMRVRTLLLTGDSQGAAAAVARELGIDAMEAELMPETKLARVRELVAQGRVVAMVGDGINDAPALTAASVGVAMGSGTDVARESADLVLLGNDLLKFTQTIALARWTRRIVYQNFIGTIVVDLAGIGLAAAGLLHPTMAALIHVSSELAFILNSARLLPRGPHPSASGPELEAGQPMPSGPTVAAG